jgi:citrate synthase
MVHLLLSGELPGAGEAVRIREGLHLASQRLPEKVRAFLSGCDGSERPLDVASACLSVVSAGNRPGIGVSRKALSHDAISAIGLYARVVAEQLRKKRGLGPCETPPSHLDHVGRFLHLSFGTVEPTKAKILGQLLVGASEVGLTTSSFAGRVAASARSDLYSSLCGAIATWKGYRHGGASEHAYLQLEELEASRKEPVEFYVEQSKRGIPAFGFGSRVYTRGEDPRLEGIRGMAERCAEELGGRLFPAAVRAVEAMAKRHVPPNPDLYLACLSESLGFSAPETPAVAFLGRIAGVCAHVIEEHSPMRPMISVKAAYSGVPERS